MCFGQVFNFLGHLCNYDMAAEIVYVSAVKPIFREMEMKYDEIPDLENEQQYKEIAEKFCTGQAERVEELRLLKHQLQLLIPVWKINMG